MKADGKVHRPTIEIVENQAPLSETNVEADFDFVVGMLITVFGKLLIGVCSAHAESFIGRDTRVVEIVENQRRSPHVAYGYASDQVLFAG